MAHMFDPARSFRQLKQTVLNGVQNVFPIETDKRILRVSDVQIDDSQADPFNYELQKNLKVHEKDYVAPVYGTLELVDKETGKVIDKKKKFRLMDIPVLTDRFSYILGGTEYTVDKQLRMKPGIYTREKENGELESQFNLAKGGRGFKMLLNPEDNIFKLKIQSSNPPLYPILKALGIEDSDMKKAWGEKLFIINQGKTGGKAENIVMKAYKSIFNKDAPSLAQATVELQDFFKGTVLSEETTQKTIGKGFASVTPEALLRTSHKLLKVSRGEEKPDDRDSLIFKHVYDTPDLVEARLNASRKRAQLSVSRVMDRKDSINEIISKDLLNKPVRAFFVQGDIASATEQTNPTAILAQATKVTSLGEGAIGDMNAVTESMRAVNPSHAGVLDCLATPESAKIGLNLHLAIGSKIENKEFKTLVKNKESGKSTYENVKDLFDKKVAFADAYNKEGKPKSKLIPVLYKGQMIEVPDKEVEYVHRSPKQLFGYLSNMVPFLANIQGNRGFMANKMLSQAIPLKYREAPLVQTKTPAGQTFEKFSGNIFSASSKADGVITKVTNTNIVVKDEDGKEHDHPIYNNFPLNNKSFIHSDPIVKVGDKVKAGDTVADTIYTKNGDLAIGTNLRVAFLPFRDNTFEDGYVISESASKKLTSEHLREISVQTSRDDKLDLKQFRAHYPTAISNIQAGKLDEEGIIKNGSTVEPGDILIAHLQRVEALPEDAKLGKLSKSLVKGFRNNSQIWDKDVIGKVVDVVKTSGGVKVFVRTEEPMQIGDKMVGRHGNKGVVSKVIPDAEMPTDKDGNHIEVAISPLAIPGRINISQVLETAAGKIADKLGKPLKIDNFSDYNAVEEMKSLMKKSGLSDKEELSDPTTGQSLGKVMVGKQYFLKLVHQISKKINARGNGPSYDVDLQPTKGGHTSARAMDRLTWNSMIAHGARENLFEMTNYKAEQNPELWRAIQMGMPLPAPKTPFVMNKLLGYLAAGGVNVRKDGNKMYLMPITDKDILSKSNGKIDEAKIVVSKNLRAVEDGLFDDVKTGGLKGTKWTHVELAEPVLNPAMENAAKTILGINQTKLDSIISGKTFYHPDTKELDSIHDAKALTGGEALKLMFKAIDVDARYSELKKKTKELSGQSLDKANKEFRFLRALKKMNIKPEEAYMLHNAPILPPAFRPLYPLPDGSLNSHPMNYLYRDLIMVNRQLKEMKDLDNETKSELRGDLYKALKAVQGIGDPLVDRGAKRIAGAIELIKGGAPKEGFFQSTVFSKNQDLSGSSAITPSTEMSMDEIMMPRDMAWDLYKPFIIKELIKMGYKGLDAFAAVKNRTPQAYMALDRAVANRPVWMNRAPSLHKFNVLAMQPKLYDGKSIKIHPSVVTGYTADFDGDSSIDAVFGVVDLKKLDKVKSTVDFRDGRDYTHGISAWSTERSISMPSNVYLPLLENEVAIHLNLKEFPRIKGSEITTEKGTIVYKVPEGIKIVTIDNETHQPVAVPVTEFSIHPDLENSVVEFHDGSSVWVSNDHSIMSLNMETLILEKTKPSDLTGRAVPKVRNMERCTDSIKSIELIDHSVGLAVKTKVKESVDLTEKLGHFIGMMVGDGWASRDARTNADSSTLCFANLDEGLAELFESGVNDLINSEKKRYSINNPHEFDGHQCQSRKHSIGCVSLAGNIKTWIGHGAHEKHLPPFYLAAPREFRLGLLAGFIDTDGSSLWAKAASKKNPQYIMTATTVSARLIQELVTLCRSLGIGASITTTNKEYRLVISALTVHDKNIPLKHPAKLKAYTEYCSKPIPESASNAVGRNDLVPFSKALYTIGSSVLSKARKSPDMTLYTLINRAGKVGVISRLTAKKIIARCPAMPKAWVDIVNNESVTWVYATKVSKNPHKVEMYDITAPGPYTFMTSSGIIVQDTMGVYVPITNKAIEEAKNYTPSKTLDHASDSSIIAAPTHDILVGLYYLTREGKDKPNKYDSITDALKDYKTKKIEIFDNVTIDGTKTSIGKYLVMHELPASVAIPAGGITKASLKGFLKNLASNGTEQYRTSMDNLSRLAAKYNISSSISVGLDDITPGYKEREKPLKDAVEGIRSAKTLEQKKKLVQQYSGTVDLAARRFLTSNPENALSQLHTASGKPAFDQFRQILSTPFAVADELGEPVPVPITKSYSEGLASHEYWAASYGARRGMIQKRLETAEPGYFSKQMISATINNTISTDDCGTKNGVWTSLDNPNDVLGRYEAGTNKLIDQPLFLSLTKGGKKQIKLRSPLTCEVKEGTCAHCYGLRENGQPARIGDNVGALAGQFLSEPATQGSMKAFHSGSVLTSGVQTAEGLDRLQQLTLVPKYLRDKATLATTDGKITKIEDNPAGGKLVWIGDEKHLVGVRNKLISKVGDKVSKGDVISDGPIKPQELLALKGIEPTQKYLVDSLQSTFKSMGKDINKKLIETVVRSTTNLTTVEDPGDHPYYVAGDTAPLQEILAWNRNHQNEMDVSLAEGAVLAASAGPFKAGTTIDKDKVKVLKTVGVQNVLVESTPIKHSPSLISMEILARMHRDWLSKLNTNHLEEVITSGAQTGDVSAVHSYDPTGPYVLGTTFGKGEKGKY